MTHIVEEVVQRARAEGRRYLVDYEVFEILKSYGLPVARYGLARSKEEALTIAKEIGFPLVMKIASPDILHKSDVGGVITNVRSLEEVDNYYDHLIARVRARKPEARIQGVLLQEMVSGGIETIIGGLTDLAFGPVIMFGLGGVFVEVLKDVTFRLAPITEEEAWDMIRELRSSTILLGYRGVKSDVESLVKILVQISHLVRDLAPYVRELDLNPVMVLERGVKIVDARAVLT